MKSSRARRDGSDPTQEMFDKLLAFLGPSTEEAANKYEEIRRRLITIFTCRGSRTPEELADETFNRVARKLRTIADNYVGEPALYFYGVARKVFLESVRKRPNPVPPPARQSPDERELELECLEQCMERLTRSNHGLIVDYYREEKGAKIDHRKALARQSGIGMNALRIRAHRIRSNLQKCVFECLELNALG